MMKRELILSCEHGGNSVPQEYRDLFRSHEELLKTHRGWDPGALELTLEMANHFSLTPFTSTTTRLLVELNRSLGSKTLFSSIVDMGLNIKQKEAVLHNYYFPYRERVEGFVKEKIQAKQPLIHLSIHTFTPQLDGEERDADIGLLYDPKHQPESAFCHEWMIALESEKKDAFKVRKNYPYQGSADSLTTHLRSLYGESEYMGIELEVNQKYPLSLRSAWPSIKELIIKSLDKTLHEGRWI
jgi:predicted N-formylglutamate amidohydrolase